MKILEQKPKICYNMSVEIHNLLYIDHLTVSRFRSDAGRSAETAGRRSMIKIRNIQLRDFEAIRMLSREVQDIHVAARPDLFAEDALLSRVSFASQFGVFKDYSFVAEDEDGQIVGYCRAFLKPPAPMPRMKVRRVVMMDELCVREDRRRQGIGNALLGAVRTAAQETNAVALEMTAWSFNDAAMAFYRQAGLRERTVVFETGIEPMMPKLGEI